MPEQAHYDPSTLVFPRVRWPMQSQRQHWHHAALRPRPKIIAATVATLPRYRLVDDQDLARFCKLATVLSLIHI